MTKASRNPSPKCHSTQRLEKTFLAGTTKFIVEDAETNLKELFPKYMDSPAIDGTRLTLKSGWILIRVSGTEPLVRLTSEAESISTGREIMEESTRLIRERIGDKRK